MKLVTIIIFSLIFLGIIIHASYFASSEIKVKVIETYKANQTVRRGKFLDIPLKIFVLSEKSVIAKGEKVDILLEALKEVENKIKVGSILLVKYEYGDFDPPPDGSDTSFHSWHLIKILD
ncbi:MAG: hypothetical protein OEV44_10200 [Spirochaetota bacterium]|nr:hypothetical protein [Spirochaetota bacterium]